jgi:hypothetical protein
MSDSRQSVENNSIDTTDIPWHVPGAIEEESVSAFATSTQEINPSASRSTHSFNSNEQVT